MNIPQNNNPWYRYSFLIFIAVFYIVNLISTEFGFSIVKIWSEYEIFFLLIGVIVVYIYYVYHKKTDQVRVYIDKNISILGKSETITNLLAQGYPEQKVLDEIAKQEKEDVDVFSHILSFKNLLRFVIYLTMLVGGAIVYNYVSEKNSLTIKIFVVVIITGLFALTIRRFGLSFGQTSILNEALLYTVMALLIIIFFIALPFL